MGSMWYSCDILGRRCVGSLVYCVSGVIRSCFFVVLIVDM